MLPTVIATIPKGFEPGEIKEESLPGAPPDLKMLQVSPKSGIGEPVSVTVMKLKERFYVAFGVRKKVEGGPRR